MKLLQGFSDKGKIGFLTAFFCIFSYAMTTCYASGPPADAHPFLIAVFPVYNLSKTRAPLKEIRQALREDLKNQGVKIIDEALLEQFIVKYRVRYMGGITRTLAQALRRETGAEAFLITTLEQYSEALPPKIALTVRLVSTQADMPVLWADGRGLAGDDAPGLLNLNFIKDPKLLLTKAVQRLSSSLSAYLSGQSGMMDKRKIVNEFQPKEFYSSPFMSPNTTYRVAVLPFFNISTRPYAGEIIALHFIRHLKAYENFEIIDPEEVRHTLLNLRIIMDDGISLADADVIFSMLNADLILTGKILEYQDYEGGAGKPVVDFSAQLIDRKSREIVWSSRSYNEGDEGVIFFGLGKVNTAHTLASSMVFQAVDTIGK